MTRYTLYGADVSYFTGKARAYLRHKGLHFIEKPSDVVTLALRTRRHNEDLAMPIVTGPEGEWLQDIDVSPNMPARGCGGLELPGSCGTTYKMAISKDPDQRYLYVADTGNALVHIVDRQSGEELGSFGGNGRYAGQLHWVNAIGIDSDGNIYTGEVEHAKRIQKFEPVWQ